jgi:hypothetical protein
LCIAALESPFSGFLVLGYYKTHGCKKAKLRGIQRRERRKMTTLEEKIKQEQEKLDGLLKKRTALDRKIKKVQSSLEKLRLIRNNERYFAIEEATQGTGLSVEDILTALKSGDLQGLQERMEAVQGIEETEIIEPDENL